MVLLQYPYGNTPVPPWEYSGIPKGYWLKSFSHQPCKPQDAHRDSSGSS